MTRIDGGEFDMGSDDFFPEERPVHRRRVDGFWIDTTPVTVAEFAEFVDATGYVSVAERPIDPARYPGVDPALLVPGGLVFVRPDRPVPLDDWSRWWAYRPGARWRRDGAGDHPVTQIAFEDAQAFATWAGKSLPTEAEWEFAARGGTVGTVYAWGDDVAPDGRRMANTWVGRFPSEFIPGDGQHAEPGTTPVGTYPPNGYGLSDMIGNVWEWTVDEYRDRHVSSCCGPSSPMSDGVVRRVIKGGSHLCAPNYCLRYRPAARQSQDDDTSTSHIGFRCVVRD
ncbi:formylglycine-generating enzyme family protein [Gordonia spumicola]|nr:formylglycine-generating enzyme family protein [Gordonia spumicola]